MDLTTILPNFIQALSYIGVVTMFLLLTKIISDKLSSAHFNADCMIEENNNNAVAFKRAGLYLGTAIGMFGALSGADHTYVLNIKLLILDGLLITCFMLLTHKINDKFIIDGIKNTEAIKNKNNAVGIVEAGSYIATGIIAYASMSGTGGPWWSSIVYFILGQFVLLLLVRLYEAITPYAVVDDVEEGNVAAGVMLFGMLISLSLVLKGTIAGPFTTWGSDLTNFGISTLSGFILIFMIFNQVIDKLFLPGTDIKTEIECGKNTAAIMVVASVKISMALIISAVVL